MTNIIEATSTGAPGSEVIGALLAVVLMVRVGLFAVAVVVQVWREL